MRSVMTVDVRDARPGTSNKNISREKTILVSLGEFDRQGEPGCTYVANEAVRDDLLVDVHETEVGPKKGSMGCEVFDCRRNSPFVRMKKIPKRRAQVM